MAVAAAAAAEEEEEEEEEEQRYARFVRCVALSRLAHRPEHASLEQSAPASTSTKSRKRVKTEGGDSETVNDGGIDGACPVSLPRPAALSQQALTLRAGNQELETLATGERDPSEEAERERFMRNAPKPKRVPAPTKPLVVPNELRKTVGCCVAGVLTRDSNRMLTHAAPFLSLPR